MLKRSSPRFILVLVYAVLEWALLILLLLNSFFSYLITKFANYFGLKPPCPWCSSRVEHMLEPQKSYSDLVCEIHANEISKMGYCLNHKRLAESHTMCWNCFSSQPNCRDNSTQSRIHLISMLSDKDQKEPSICSCCSESFSSKLSPLSLEYAQKGDSGVEAVRDDNIHNNEGTTKPDSMSVNSENGYEMETTSSLRDTTAEEHYCRNESKKLVHQSSNATTIEYCCFQEDHSLETTPLPSESHRPYHLRCSLIPSDSIDFSTSIDQGFIYSLKDQEHHDPHQGCFKSELKIESEHQLPGETALLMITKSGASTSNRELKNLEMIKGFTEDSSVAQVEKRNLYLVGKLCDNLVTSPEAHPTLSVDSEGLTDTKEPKDPPASKEERILAVILRNQSNTQVSDHAANQPQELEDSSLPFLEISNVPDSFPAYSDVGKSILQEKTRVTENAQEIGQNFCMCTEPREPKEERLVGGQNCVHSVHYLYEKTNEKDGYGTANGSMASVMNGGDSVTTIEQLKAALKAESKALSALYAELEEERSASAVAANETMAMITRLQEEKAAMQMEALQYQRMMEEQSEYDQEALQLLNELVNKMEREKQELEKELEIYQKKVLDYEEEKEKKQVMSKAKYGSRKSINSSCSQSWDSDALSIDLNCEARDEDSSFHEEGSKNIYNADDTEALSLEEMALDCVKQMSILDDSLTGIQKERLSILDQLKALEDRLIVLSENGDYSQEAKLIEHCPNYSTKNIEDNDNCSSPEEKQISDEKMTLASMAKKLLPLLGVADVGNETEEGLTNDKQVRTESIAMNNSVISCELHDTRIAIEEEVDHVYERLQALEGDREFLEQCMSSSINQGDNKGMDLLQESLQHLRDLRDVELRMRHINDPVDEAEFERAL